MKSIRLSLTVYFLGLLALALGTASLLAYQTSYLTLQDKKAATEELIKAQYKESCKEDTDRLDRKLLDQAEKLAELVQVRIDGGQFRERQAQLVGLLTALPSPNGHVLIHVWRGQSFPPSPWRRDEPRLPDPFAELYKRMPRINLRDLREDDQFPTLGGLLADYYQIDSPLGGTLRSEKLGERSMPLDTKTYRPNEVFASSFDSVVLTNNDAPVRRAAAAAAGCCWCWSTIVLPPEDVSLRRVILKIPSGMGRPPRPPRPPGSPGAGRDPAPPDVNVLDFSNRPPIYIQCAVPTANLDRRLQELKNTQDTELAKVEAETTDSLAALRNRLLVMSLLTFAVITVGTWWLVRLGLLPLDRLSVAVSKVSAKDFRLQFDEPRLPSELRPIRDRLADTLEQLKRAFAREQQATADISHELRTPLAALLTTMELALRKTRSAEEYREMFQDCLVSAQHMNQVVERLLALARLDAGVDHLRPKNVDVGQLADQCAAMVRPLAEARGLNLTVNHRAGVEATVDPDKMREIMINLLHNAIQYNRPNGSVTLTVARPNGKVEVAVSDTGIGIAPEKQDQIFERFFRADPSRGADGVHAGLGLAIVKGYVDLMGGALDVDSEVNRGSTFRIRLPVPS